MYLSSLAAAITLGAVVRGQAITPTPGQSVEFGFNSVCLTADSNTDGASVYIAQCSLDRDNRSWNVTAGGSASGKGAAGPLKAFGNKCLDVKDGVNADGTKLQLWTCANGSKNQMWNVNSDGTIAWTGTNKCLDLTSGSFKDGNPIQVWTCGTGNPNQKWTAMPIGGGPPLAAGAKVAFTVDEPAIHENGCLTASGTTNGSPVVISRCLVGTGSNDANQVWTSTAGSAVSGKGPAGQIQIFGNKCLDVTGGSTTDGTKLQIWSCTSGDKNQLWTINGDTSIGWAGTTKCMDLTGGNVTDGNPIQSWACGKFNLNQQWGLRNAA